MARVYIEDEKMEKIDFSEKPLSVGDYEGCDFIACNFANADLSGIHFSDCRFNGCNFHMTKLIETTLADIKFQDCKLQGLHFEQCTNPVFVVDFVGCTLNFSSFYQMKVRKTRFKDSSLREVDFTGTDLHAAVFDNCDLVNAKFERTILEKADLRTSYNYTINPDLNQIKRAKFSLQGVIGLLGKYDIEIE